MLDKKVKQNFVFLKIKIFLSNKLLIIISIKKQTKNLRKIYIKKDTLYIIYFKERL